ncbi:hypothetical protein EJ04DRAFT_571965 [Polyplosphaeria fusca]|uniref:Voltage-gated hydrogen channel 1 n=1 Tax=Polyplosphaeria fusca TaxID=682080 RepID=A0A9P4V791_9PLEO|nr:hypothetical protein EJ04DRAFT_571965 [Polyplosphaeria fusca]
MSSSPLLHPELHQDDEDSTMTSTRQQLHRVFLSKTFHYSILLLVALDVAYIVVNLLTCDHRSGAAETTLKALEYVGLTFSCLFVLELLASLWAFGLHYLRSKFHVFDAVVIIASFVVEVTLQGVDQEIASLVVILRLIRVVKIVDELSVGAEEQMKELADRLADAEKENVSLREQVEVLRHGQGRTI